MNYDVAFVLPTFGHFDYARAAALSFFKCSPDRSIIIMIDDASPGYDEVDWQAWKQDLPQPRIMWVRYEHNGGLTRSWNTGLRLAREMHVKYTVCGNSDILFSPGWCEPLIAAAEQGWKLVGPCSNAPGVTAKHIQDVRFYVPRYFLSDTEHDIAKVAGALAALPDSDRPRPSDINGFFMLAATDSWWEGRFSENHVFDPSRRMTGNEDELEKRWKRRGFQIGVVPRSFIFHYRSVTRGKRFATAGSYRKT